MIAPLAGAIIFIWPVDDWGSGQISSFPKILTPAIFLGILHRSIS
jgi:hypothetical protein